MTNTQNNNPDEKALDALAAFAFRKEFDDDEIMDILLSEPKLSEEDMAALDGLSPNIVDEVMNETWVSANRVKSVLESELEYTVAMHRSDPDSEITENARLEMEKKIKELERDGDENT